jgi:hypothetical protein
VSKKLTLALLITFGFALSLGAQELVLPEEISGVNRLIDSEAKQRALNCAVHHWGPILGLDLRYHIGFSILSSFRQFAVGDEGFVFLRVTPQGGSPVLLGQSFKIPPIPRGLAVRVAAKSDVNLIGAFAVGPGRYKVELLVIDRHGRSFSKRWKLKTSTPSKQAVASELGPLTVRPLAADNWSGQLDPKGVRLTVLLDATATSVTAAKLRDEAFLLLQLLASLLRQVPCQWVRIVAFNLDQQREVFRQENFDAAGFAKLSAALRQVQFSTVSYQALQRRSWSKFLLRITEEQISANNPPDAVVFIGASTHFMEKVPKELRESLVPGPAHFFYFEYYGYRVPLPDAIDYLTHNLKGTVFRINSAKEFGKAIQKMLAQLGANQTSEPR